jgi:uncharacterized alpha-E superfamily protein
MLSRVAENIYWMARYIERAENTARLINVNTFLLLDLPKKVRFGWMPLIEITGSGKLYKQLYNDETERSGVRFLVGDEDNPGSLVASVAQARENVRTIRDVVPRETSEQINELYLFARNNLARGLTHAGRFEYLKSIILRCQTITGLLAGTMVHDAGYDFLRMGRNLERADMTTRLIDVRSANLLPDVSVDLRPFENVQWMSVLKSLSGYQAYRRIMQVNVRRPEVLRFLFQEKNFPRAFYHAICEVFRVRMNRSVRSSLCKSPCSRSSRIPSRRPNCTSLSTRFSRPWAICIATSARLTSLCRKRRRNRALAPHAAKQLARPLQRVPV